MIFLLLIALAIVGGMVLLTGLAGAALIVYILRDLADHKD